MMVYAIGQLEGNMQSEPPYKANGQPYCLSQINSTAKLPLGKSPKGAICIIPIQGIMMKDDQISDKKVLYPGMDSICRWAQQANADPNIDGIVLHVTSPGGMVMGCEQLNATLAGLDKPTVAFVDGLAASAAYFAICGVDQIISNGNSSRVGSIGTMQTITDTSGMLAKFGIVQRNVYATDSADKNKEHRDALAGDDTALITQGLDPVNAIFQNAVKTGRAGKINTGKENVLSGKVYHGADAKKHGLVDSVGTFSSAMKSVRKLADNKKSTNMSNALKFAVFAAVMGWEAGFETTAEGVHIQEEALQTLEESLTAGATATAGLAVSEAALVTANETIANMQTAADASVLAATASAAKITALNVQVTALGKAPSGKGSATHAASDETTGGEHIITPAYLADADPANAWLDKQLNKESKADYNKLLNS